MAAPEDAAGGMPGSPRSWSRQLQLSTVCTLSHPLSQIPQKGPEAGKCDQPPLDATEVDLVAARGRQKRPCAETDTAYLRELSDRRAKIEERLRSIVTSEIGVYSAFAANQRESAPDTESAASSESGVAQESGRPVEPRLSLGLDSRRVGWFRTELAAMFIGFCVFLTNFHYWRQSMAEVFFALLLVFAHVAAHALTHPALRAICSLLSTLYIFFVLSWVLHNTDQLYNGPTKNLVFFFVVPVAVAMVAHDAAMIYLEAKLLRPEAVDSEFDPANHQRSGPVDAEQSPPCRNDALTH